MLTTKSQSFHATHVQGATVNLNFTGTGVRVFSATVPNPGSYEVYVDGMKLSERVDSSSQLDPQLLLGSITGLEMAPHTVTLVNSGVTGNILDLDRVEVESMTTSGRCGILSLRRVITYRTDCPVHPCLPQPSTTLLTEFNGGLDGFPLLDSPLSITAPSSTSILCTRALTSTDGRTATRNNQMPR